MQKVSTTRGVPSSSTDLKEALCEKIPLHYDLLRKFRARHGSSVISEITVNDLYNGLRDVSTVVRETSEIDALHGVHNINKLRNLVTLKLAKINFCSYQESRRNE